MKERARNTLQEVMAFKEWAEHNNSANKTERKNHQKGWNRNMMGATRQGREGGACLGLSCVPRAGHIVHSHKNVWTRSVNEEFQEGRVVTSSWGGRVRRGEQKCLDLVAKRSPEIVVRGISKENADGTEMLKQSCVPVAASHPGCSWVDGVCACLCALTRVEPHWRGTRLLVSLFSTNKRTTFTHICTPIQ